MVADRGTVPAMAVLRVEGCTAHGRGWATACWVGRCSGCGYPIHLWASHPAPRDPCASCFKQQATNAAAPRQASGERTTAAAHATPSTKAAQNPYALLDVPRDASPERIRNACERAIARAHRDGATKHAVEISTAFDTLSNPTRRALFDRHGMPAVRERSPGAAAPPTPWRVVKEQGFTPPLRRTRRERRTPLMAVFSLGIVAGLVIAGYLLRESGSEPGVETTGPSTGLHQVACDPTPAGPGYVYTGPSQIPPHAPTAPCHGFWTPGRRRTDARHRQWVTNSRSARGRPASARNCTQSQGRRPELLERRGHLMAQPGGNARSLAAALVAAANTAEGHR